jgi:hypothetical protein
MTDDLPEGPMVVIGTGAGNLRRLTGEHAPATINDPIADIAPTVSGQHGRAWLCDLEPARRRFGVPAEKDSRLAVWLIEAAWAHPIWHSYLLSLVHLRPLGRGGATLRYLDEATHELCLWALDADADRRAVIASSSSAEARLEPLNFAAQFVEISDELAAARVQRTVQQICDGQLSPDTDHIRSWVALYGDNMLSRQRPITRPKGRE